MRYFASLFTVLPSILLLCVAAFASAAETQVPPGNGTLAQAVADAADGDALILENGTYLGDVLVDKSLTIRGTNSFAVVMIAGSSFVVNKAGARVTLQGLDFGTSLVVQAAADVRILENSFYNGADINMSGYRTSEGDGSLAIIGNRLAPGGNISVVQSVDAYIAGNTLMGGTIQARVPAWIVGNEVNGAGDSNAIHVNAGVGGAQVLANRVTLNGGGVGTLFGIYVNASHALISGNLVRINQNSTSGRVRYGIFASNQTFARVFNNVVDGGALLGFLHPNSRGIQAYGEVSGNIVTNLRKDASPIGGSGIDYNLCFSNYNNSACGDNAIASDPKFVDRVDYRLAADSPAIDAGPDNPFVADLDRTRNDIGAHGGPWAIGQYDAQRDPLYLAPFVYPLFDANASFIDGNLQVRALGVARLR